MPAICLIARTRQATAAATYVQAARCKLRAWTRGTALTCYLRDLHPFSPVPYCSDADIKPHKRIAPPQI